VELAFHNPQDTQTYSQVDGHNPGYTLALLVSLLVPTFAFLYMTKYYCGQNRNYWDWFYIHRCSLQSK